MGLKYISNYNVSHIDIKPANILVNLSNYKLNY